VRRPDATANEGAALVGRRIGGYELLGPLGAGGMGEVYRARDRTLGRDVAIKILPDMFTRNPERVERIQREARMLAALSHPNIAAIFGVEDAEGMPALILELVDGVTLAERLAQGPVPLPEALAIARQIADALAAAHDKGIIHRDLKPANVKIAPNGLVKGLDFGLATVSMNTAGADGTDVPTVAELTREGVMIGTTTYMSPEQVRGIGVDKRTDIWAFGCVLFEMISGAAAFGAETPSDAIGTIMKGEPDWSLLPPGTPVSIRTLLRWCLQKDPARRLRDIADARLRLDETLESPTPVPLIRRGTNRERIAWISALAIATILAFAAWFTRPSDSQAPEVPFWSTCCGNRRSRSRLF
jgi:serine/threonine protein kinase